MRFADHRGFGDGLMAHKRAFDLRRTDAIAGYFNDVVGAAHKPQIAVFIFSADISRRVAVRDRVPVGSGIDPDLCRSSASWQAMAS